MYQKSLSIEEICRKLKPIFGKKVDEIYLRYSMAETREEKEDIAHFLNALYQKNLSKLLERNILLEPPTQEQVSGDYPIAPISYANKKLYQFSLREEDWPRHVCISGMSGSGKTTLAFNIIENFIKKGKPFLVFDWKKSFRPLMNSGDKVMCFTLGNDNITNIFRINVNRPPQGINPEEWINILCDLITESFNASFGVHKVILETLDMAFKKNKVYEGSGNYPTWDDMKIYLEQKAERSKGREAQWVESALRIATVLTFGSISKIINSKEKESLKIEDLLDKQVILELDALGNVEKKFLCEYILTYIHKLQKLRQPSLDRELNYAIIVDEAHNVFLKDKTNFVKESVTDMIYREIREYGVSLICLDQHISKLSDTVKGNSACHIAFQQQLPEDLYDISGLMQLRENKEVFNQLPVGSAIVKLSERYTQPFLVEVLFSEARKEIITDQEIVEKMQRIILGKNKEIPTINEIINEIVEESKFTKINVPKVNEIVNSEGLTKKQEILNEYVEKKLSQGKYLKDIEKTLESGKSEGNYTSLDVIKAINHSIEIRFKEFKKARKNIEIAKNESIKKENDIENSPNISNYNGLTKDQEKLLEFVKVNLDHDLPATQIYKKIGLSARKGNKIKDELVEKKMVKIQEVRNEKGWKKLIRLN